MRKMKTEKIIPALKVNQWLKEWDDIQWEPAEKRAKPNPWFYQFSISAKELRVLSAVYPRTTDRRRSSDDTGIQRAHDIRRSSEINQFVQYGYPWSNLSEKKRTSGEFQDLRQPGWLPTAIVINILTGENERNGEKVDASDLIDIKEGDNGVAELILPNKKSRWRPKSVPPIEIIDGQHRLWAFDDDSIKDDYELPVVAFVGLDLSWQAYLFYTINIKPKKINASLAFDLYPLLRSEKWLMKFEGHAIYRETRAQEIVDFLWAHSQSPWYHRINMLGARGQKGHTVTQASWIRSLLASFVKSWEGPQVRIGGLFGTEVGRHKTVLPWTRIEQVAFLIFVGQVLRDTISNRSEPWMLALREQKQPEFELLKHRDRAFFGPSNLLNNDQGIRAMLQVVNDLFYVRAESLELALWGGDLQNEVVSDKDVTRNISSLRKNKKIYEYLQELCDGLASYDWRTSTGPELTHDEKIQKAAFRGSGGYKELRRDVLQHLAKGKSTVARAATEVFKKLGY